MEEILSQIVGAGQVRVMLTMGTSASIYAQNSQTSHSATIELDGEGGERNIDVESSSHSYVMVRQSDGSERPLRIQELRPETLGVIIVAEGAGDVAVRDALTRAAHTVLGIGAHRVQVFQMEVK
jgi:stage III sporulation protein AG